MFLDSDFHKPAVFPQSIM